MADSSISTDTDRLTARLAGQAGQTRGPHPRRLARQLILASLLAGAVAVTEILLAIGPRPDMAAAVHGPAIYFKLAAMGLLVAVSSRYVLQSALPDRRQPRLLLTLPIWALVLLRLATDHSGQSWLGVHPFSFIVCVCTIVIASLVPLALLLWTVRRGAARSPGLCGAMTGLLAGSLGALAYAIACQNDAGAFLLVWYPVATACVAAIGYIAGRRILRW